MHVSILQYPIVWMSPQENLAYIDRQLSELTPETDLFILPEMFTTGVSNKVAHIAETMTGLTLSTLKQWAASYRLAICGSLLIQENRHYYNRFVFVKPDGEVNTYDKRHLFTLGGEHETVTAGKTCPIIHYKSWRVKPQVCYDLRFPVWSRNTENYDLLIYVANWPKSRSFIYSTLLRARAMENQCYVCACNRTGVDGNKIVYNGNSLIINAHGESLADAREQEVLISCELSKAELEKYRSRFPVLNDGDAFRLEEM